MADALLGIETLRGGAAAPSRKSFTLADALLGIETKSSKSAFDRVAVSLWLMPF